MWFTSMKHCFYLALTLFLSLIMVSPAQAAKAKAYQNTEIGCMGQAIFYEAAGEPYQGQVAVANVIFNRMSSGIYPRTVCGVIRERGQFQWVNNHKLRKKRVYHATKRDKRIHNLASKLYRQYKSGKRHDTTRGSLFFSSNGVRPAPRAVKSVKIGRHQFFTLRKFKFNKNRKLA